MEIHGFVLRRYCNSRLYMQTEMFRMEVQKNLPSHISLAFSLRLKRSDLPSPEKGVLRQWQPVMCWTGTLASLARRTSCNLDVWAISSSKAVLFKKSIARDSSYSLSCSAFSVLSSSSREVKQQDESLSCGILTKCEAARCARHRARHTKNKKKF